MPLLLLSVPPLASELLPSTRGAASSPVRVQTAEPRSSLRPFTRRAEKLESMKNGCGLPSSGGVAGGHACVVYQLAAADRMRARGSRPPPTRRGCVAFPVPEAPYAEARAHRRRGAHTSRRHDTNAPPCPRLLKLCLRKPARPVRGKSRIPNQILQALNLGLVGLKLTTEMRVPYTEIILSIDRGGTQEDDIRRAWVIRCLDAIELVPCVFGPIVCLMVQHEHFQENSWQTLQTKQSFFVPVHGIQ